MEFSFYERFISVVTIHMETEPHEFIHELYAIFFNSMIKLSTPFLQREFILCTLIPDRRQYMKRNLLENAFEIIFVVEGYCQH